MKNKRSFSLEFKRQVVEELLSGQSRPVQLCHRHNSGDSLLYRRKKQYSWDKSHNCHSERHISWGGRAYLFLGEI
ncbi:MAG: transposase [Dehalococcoidia bacterium]|nr:transposase [Dehalococcoidia bacterium]